MAEQAWPMNDGLTDEGEGEADGCIDIPLPPSHAWINGGIAFVGIMFLGTLVNLFQRRL